MTWLKVTGMIPAETNNAWASGTITATPLRTEDEGWADGTRRAVWPIEGVLAGAGTRFEARLGGDFYLPGANIGESAVPPSIELLAELKDQQGRTRRFRSVGKVAASAPGEWSVNAPLGSVVIKGQNSGPNSWLETTVADVVAATAAAQAQTAAQAIQMVDSAQLHDTLTIIIPDAQTAAAAKPDALLAAAAKGNALSAAALLGPLSAASAQAANDHDVATQLATQLGSIPTAVKGLKVQNAATGEQGGSLWDFVQDTTATTTATLSAGEQGGLLYDLTGGV